ncbi:MAG TPA: hypothetical protein VKW06_00385 [Candidatus Angelobacter sp.]|nr:hypothetical protein [Candidatus Angelobacter sp.]
MTCRHCHDDIYEVIQVTGPPILVHQKTGLRHCNADFEVKASTIAEPAEVKSV